MGWDKPAGLAGQDQIFGSLDGRSNHWEAGSHCLQYNVGHSFPERGVNEHIGRLEQARDIVASA